MEFTDHSYSLATFSADAQLTIYLLQEELKSRKFFNALRDLGLDGCCFQPHLDTVILRGLGMDPESDTISDAYFKIIERRSGKISGDKRYITKQAIKAYHDLLNEKGKRMQKII